MVVSITMFLKYHAELGFDEKHYNYQGHRTKSKPVVRQGRKATDP